MVALRFKQCFFSMIKNNFQVTSNYPLYAIEMNIYMTLQTEYKRIGENILFFWKNRGRGQHSANEIFSNTKKGCSLEFLGYTIDDSISGIPAN